MGRKERARCSIQWLETPRNMQCPGIGFSATVRPPVPLASALERFSPTDHCLGRSPIDGKMTERKRCVQYDTSGERPACTRRRSLKMQSISPKAGFAQQYELALGGRWSTRAAAVRPAVDNEDCPTSHMNARTNNGSRRYSICSFGRPLRLPLCGVRRRQARMLAYRRKRRSL